MGIFDIFTGDAQKQAAQQQQQFLSNTLNTGRSDLSNAYNQGAGAIQSGTNAARPILSGTYGQARSDIGSGQDAALGYIDQATGRAVGAYSPLTQLGQKYGGATSLQLDALGVNGPEGTARAQQSFQAGPGYQWQVDQGIDAINRQKSASGQLASGNASVDALKYASGLASQEYNNWINNLGGYVNPELSATSGAASGIAGVESGAGAQRAGIETGRGQMLADLASRYGTNAAGLETGQGTALANLATNQGNQNVNLAGQIAQPYANTYQNAANAQAQGSGNLWGLGMNLATLGTGALGQSGLLKKWAA